MKDLKTTLFIHYHNATIAYDAAVDDFMEKAKLVGDPNKVYIGGVSYWEHRRLALFDLISEAGLKAEYDLWEAEQEKDII